MLRYLGLGTLSEADDPHCPHVSRARHLWTIEFSFRSMSSAAATEHGAMSMLNEAQSEGATEAETDGAPFLLLGKLGRFGLVWFGLIGLNHFHWMGTFIGFRL